MTNKPYSERIPAAIAKGEGWFKQPGIIDVAVLVNEKGGAVYVTAGEVALAKALWETHRKFCDEYNWDYEEPPPALIVYCEKIERLSHD